VVGFRALLAASAIVPLTLLAGCTQGISPAVLPGTTARPAHAGHAGPGGNAIPASPAPAPISLSETGSTLLYPLFAAWASAYHREFPMIVYGQRDRLGNRHCRRVDGSGRHWRFRRLPVQR
jgi:ABC-type phosphate transport system substrate-binding protein